MEGKEVVEHSRISPLKLLMFNDLMEYLKKRQMVMLVSTLREWNFTPEEIEVITEIKHEEIIMHNATIIRQTNGMIKVLESENEQLKKEIDNLKMMVNDKKSSNKKSHFVYEMDDENNYIVSVDDGKNKNIAGKIPITFIVEMFDIILTLNKNNKNIGYKDIVKEIIYRHNLDVSIEAFNGGKNRQKYYFKHYYYPLKILEHLKKIEYKKQNIKPILPVKKDARWYIDKKA